MDVLMQPLIIDRIFKFSSVSDVDQCQYVCRVWREAALRILKKCPPIDICQSVFTDQIWYPGKQAKDKDGERQKNEILMENHRMNVEGSPDKYYPPGYAVFYWYLKRGSSSDLLPMSKVDRTIEGFLTSDAKCVAKFSFLQYNERVVGRITRGITFNHPTLLIKTEPRNVFNGPVIREFNSKIKPLDIVHKEKFPGLSFHTDAFSFTSYFDGFHINRYLPGVRITITDWSDSQSARPDMNDPKFPVKSVLYFATSINYYHAKIKEIEKLLENSPSKPIFSGGPLRSIHGCEDPSGLEEDLMIFGDEYDQSFKDEITTTMSYVGPRSSKPKESSIITIAFAGRGVKSAAYDILFEQNLEEQLEEFKRTLDIPIDDGRLLGFILEKWYPDYCGCTDSSFSAKITWKIKDLFPSIKILPVSLDWRINVPIEVMATLHLIRI